MKTRQRNGIKFKVFEKEDIIEKLNGTEEDWNLVNKYQLTFPELLIEDCIGYCVDARTLHSNLVENVKEGKVGTEFAKWIKRRLLKTNFVENEDYKTIVKFDDGKFSLDEVNLMSQQKRSSYGITTEYKITLDVAKHLCMMENNSLGVICRRYFILIERLLKDNVKWNESRYSERKNYQPMIDELRNWCVRNNYDTDEKTFKVFRMKEVNMLNISLTGYSAKELQYIKEMKDKITRDHLDTQTNKALDELQTLNTSLMMSNLSFEMRKQIIETTCKNKFSDLYIKQ